MSSNSGQPISDGFRSVNCSSLGVYVLVISIDDEHKALAVWMVFCKRAGEHACVRQVVLRDDRADVHGRQASSDRRALDSSARGLDQALPYQSTSLPQAARIGTMRSAPTGVASNEPGTTT